MFFGLRRTRRFLAPVLAGGLVIVQTAGLGGTPLSAAEPGTATPTPGRWAPTGSMTVGRGNPYQGRATATLLADGRVLVAGGASDPDGIPLASAEVYDPHTGRWTATGSMSAGRANHTATLLGDGRVLVAGGAHDNGLIFENLASAELYDPATGHWTTTGSMAAGQESATALLLPDGKVMVVGVTAETYDPGSGRWSPNPGFSGFASAAVVLPGGAVLAFDTVARTVWRYNPAGHAWSRDGRLAGGQRYGHPTATLLPTGRVLVAGGFRATPSGPPLATDSAEVYDPALHRSARTSAPMESARDYHTATLMPDGRVLLVGGLDQQAAGCCPQPTAELFDPARAAFFPTGALAASRPGRAAHTATLLRSGDVLVAGGLTGSFDFLPPILASAELYRSGCTIDRRSAGAAQRIRGTAGDDVICASAWGDTIDGVGGRDVVVGGRGDDVLVGGGGDDTLIGAGGNDILAGGSGSDMVFGGGGHDRLRGGAGEDRLYGGPGNDRLYGDAGLDTIFGGGGTNAAAGGDGSDFCLQVQHPLDRCND